MAPKKRGPAPTATAPLPERNASAAAKYYHKKEADKEHPQSWYVQRARVYKRIKDTGKLPQERTILKYGVVIKDGNVVVPKDLMKPKSVVDWVPAKKPEVHLDMHQPPVEVVPIQEGTITPLTSTEFLFKHRNRTKPDVYGEVNEYGKSWETKLKNVGNLLKRVGVMSDAKNGNLAEALDQYKKVIDLVKSDSYTDQRTKQPVKNESRKQFFKQILFHLDNNEGLRKQISKDAFTAYKLVAATYIKAGDNLKAAKLKDVGVYNWNDVMSKIENKFGKNSLENVFVRIYNEIPVRNELANIKIVGTPLENKKLNYILIPGGKTCNTVIHLGTFKTSNKYPSPDFKLSKETCGLLKTNLQKRPVEDRGVLFPFTGVRLWRWFQGAVEEAGFPLYPYGEEVPPDTKKQTQNGTRHSIATYRNSKLNTEKEHPEPYGADLAALMLHDENTSKNTYQHETILPTPA